MHIWESSCSTSKEFCNLNTEIRHNNVRYHGSVARSIEFDVIVAQSNPELEYKKKIFAMASGPGVYNEIIKNGLIGKLDIIAEIQAFQDPFDLRALELFVDSLK